MKHLGVLEEANLVTTVKVGREKRHFLNPVPIRLVHDRWIGKFAEPIVGAMSRLKTRLETSMDTFDHVYTVFIKASPERVWRAITDGDDTVRYYFGTRVVSDWSVGAPIRYDYGDGRVAADGEVLAIDPGNSLTMTFLGDFYVNGGWFGIVFGGLLFGLLCRTIATYCAEGMVRGGVQTRAARVLIAAVFAASLAEVRADAATFLAYHGMITMWLVLSLTFFRIGGDARHKHARATALPKGAPGLAHT